MITQVFVKLHAKKENSIYWLALGHNFTAAQVCKEQPKVQWKIYDKQ